MDMDDFPHDFLDWNTLELPDFDQSDAPTIEGTDQSAPTANIPAPLRPSDHQRADSLPNPYQPNLAQDVLFRGDVFMEDAVPGEASARIHNTLPAVPRPRYGHLDWESHKQEIQKLYLDENKTLKETKETMAALHSFHASEKLYKGVFRKWGWQKKLPSDTAFFMMQKAKQRKRDENKETVFNFGVLQWDSTRAERTVTRAGLANLHEGNEIVKTPEGVTYETPNAGGFLLESDTSSSDDTQLIDLTDCIDTESQSDSNQDDVCLTWEGLTATDMFNMSKMAAELQKEGKVAEAEEALRRALRGLRKISGPTSYDSKRAAQSLATMLAETGRMNDAMKILEEVIQDHVRVLGYRDRITQQIVLQTVEVLNGWNRQTEALVLLSRAKEVMKSLSSQQDTPRRQRTHQRGRGSHNPEGLSQVLESTDPSRIEFSIEEARSRMAAGDEATEHLLQAIIKQCEKDPKKLAKQHLAATGELLRFYQRQGRVMTNVSAEAIHVLEKSWDVFEWDEEKFGTFEFMEAALQLIANLLKSGHHVEAKHRFRKAAEQATVTFGYDDQRTIWILITIGLAYQAHTGWKDAEEWFERAYSTTIAAKWDRKDGIVRSLQAALNNNHFSYLSEEGRPYKTIFGVNGITVRPVRLHLE